MTTLGCLIEQHQLIRRLVLAWSLALTTYVTVTLLDWAITTPRDLLQVAAVIGAFMTPIAGFQGWALSIYNAARRDSSKGD